MSFKKLNKKVLFAAWGCHNKKWHTYQLWDQPLRDSFKEMVTFDPQEETYRYGKDEMNRRFLAVVEKEKPDYIFLWVMYHEFYPETLIRVKQMLPQAILFCYNGDDDYKFENYTIQFFPLIDYFMITQVPYIYQAEKYGKKAFFGCGADIKKFKPTYVEKDIDVSFVGTPKSDRIDYMRHLLRNGVKIRVFGAAWQRYPEFKGSFGGEIDEAGFIDVINRSKINVCLSKNYFGGTHILERFFEINACKSFCLTEYAEGYFPTFKEGKDIVTFKNQDELLEKVTFYLKNDGIRKKVAEAAYKRTLKDFSNYNLLKQVIGYAEKKGPAFTTLKPIKNKCIYLTKKDLEENNTSIERKTAEYDYICFKNRGYESLPLKDYFQMHTLELTKKAMCSCDLITSSAMIGDYATLALFYAYDYLERKYFYDFLDIAQIMVRKDYFLKNLPQFRAWYAGKKPTFITKENTTMMSFPLVRTKEIKDLPQKNSEHVLFTLYSDTLRTLRNQGKLFSTSYLYKLLLYSFFWNPQLLRLMLKEDITRSKIKRLEKISHFFTRS